MVLALILFIAGAFLIYGVYRFFNPFGELVDKDLSGSYFYNRSGDKIIYSPMGNWFELGKTEMEVDIPSFQVLAENYAKDNNKAYFKYAEVDIDVDIPSFLVKFDHVPMDKNHVYVLLDGYYYFDTSNKGFDTLPGADPRTYEYLNYKFSRDKHHLYKSDTVYTKADRESFEILNQDFCKDKNGVYQYSQQDDLIAVEEIDQQNVVTLNNTYIRDDVFVFSYFGYLGQGQEFHNVIKIPFKNSESLVFFEYDVIRIDDKIFYKGQEIKGADAETYEDIMYGYARDVNNVYYIGSVVEGADSESFTYNEQKQTFSDKNNRYEMGKIVE